ncbi:MAG: elongator complex protein 3 [Myxococcota bacterium]
MSSPGDPSPEAAGRPRARGARHRRRAPLAAEEWARSAEALVAIARALSALPGSQVLDGRSVDPILRRHPRAGSGFFSRSQLIEGVRALGRRGEAGLDPASAERLARRLALRPTRSRSGVTPLTVLTEPYPCPGRCIFCPNDARMPKSYLSDEPGAQRAAGNRFDPFLQTWNRLAAFHAIGHPTDKVELIVLGGTWSFYPEPYRIHFVTRMFEALHAFGVARERGEAIASRSPERAGVEAPDFEVLPRVLDARRADAPYNRTVQRHLARLGRHAGGAHPTAREGDDLARAWSRLEAAQRRNERGGSRCVGLVLETRPDRVDEAEVAHLRRLGATKVQLGLQSLDDAVLSANRRGHSVEDGRRAVGLLRRAGFKLHVHWMPNLLGSTPEADVLDFARLFSDPGLRPDELKIYPCSLVESAELMGPYERGEWHPYDHDTLLDVLARVLPQVPRSCRVTRVVRDISSDDIVAGNKLTHFRELAEREVARRGGRLVDIRAREIRGGSFDPDTLCLRVSAWQTAGGREEFLEWVTPDDRLLGFLRLSLPVGPAPGVLADELGSNAIIREVHVYGPALALGARGGEAQHRGLGARLVAAAAARARAAGSRALSVISAVGTREYYRRLGFRDGPLYQHLDLAADASLSAPATRR